MYRMDDKFSTQESEYVLSRGGYARFKREEIQAIGPKYEDTIVTLKNGQVYLLKGRDYGV